MALRIGFGYDVHRLAENEKFLLGGVLIKHHKGATGHSDADTLLHAICDALLGAANLGDIGTHFPDTSADYKNIDSRILLASVWEKVTTEGWELSNIDCTIALQQPKLAPYIAEMKESIAAILNTTSASISIKAKTTERLGFEGREEGVSAYAICLLTNKKD